MTTMPNLLFSEEFAGATLDASKWRTNGKWAGPTTPACQDNANNVVVSNSNLQLIARSNVPTCTKPGGYTQSIIQSGGWHAATPFAFTYGYVECRVRVPSGKGLWPAVWLYDVQGGNPEIDIAEWLCDDTKTAHQTVHFPDGTSSGYAYAGPDWATDYHVLGLNWQSGVLDWYVDGVVTRHVADPNVPSTPMYILLNLAVGGSWPGMPDATTQFPATFLVDWIRVYDKLPIGSDLQQQIDVLKGQVVDGQTALSDLQAQYAALEKANSTLSDQNAALAEQLADALLAASQATVRADAAEAQLAALQANLGALVRFGGGQTP